MLRGRREISITFPDFTCAIRNASNNISKARQRFEPPFEESVSTRRTEARGRSDLCSCISPCRRPAPRDVSAQASEPFTPDLQSEDAIAGADTVYALYEYTWKRRNPQPARAHSLSRARFHAEVKTRAPLYTMRRTSQTLTSPSLVLRVFGASIYDQEASLLRHADCAHHDSGSSAETEPQCL